MTRRTHVRPAGVGRARVRRARVRRGLTLVELLVAAALFAVVIAAVGDVVARQWRIQAALDGRRAAHAQLVAAADALLPQLRAAAGDGDSVDSTDLVVVTDTLLELRAATGASAVCAIIDPRTVELPPLSVAAPALTWWRSTPQPGDVALVHDDAAPGGVWRSLDVESVGTRAAGCAGSPLVRAAESTLPRYRLRLTTPLPPNVGVGAPVRLARRVRWLHYRASDGRWYLGEREWDGTAWTGTQPVAGPLRPPGARGGLSIRALDSTGAALAPSAIARARVAWIDVVLRADAPAASGVHGATAVDSVAFRASPRNGS